VILHIVLLKPLANLSEADRGLLRAAIERAASEIPSVRRFRIGSRLSGGPSYATAAPDAFPFAAVVEFDDREALEAYLAHPVHAELGQRFNASLETAIVGDFDAEDVWVRGSGERGAVSSGQRGSGQRGNSEERSARER
jgi:Stress responsive A/B Barrel Domain